MTMKKVLRDGQIKFLHNLFKNFLQNLIIEGAIQIGQVDRYCHSQSGAVISCYVWEGRSFKLTSHKITCLNIWLKHSVINIPTSVYPCIGLVSG